MSRRFGESKRQTGTATRDFEREKWVIERATTHARELGLSEQLAQQLMRLLIGESLEKQERDSLTAVPGQTERRCLILGGAGKMGQWFGQFLVSQGCQVRIADPNPEQASFPVDEQWQDRVDDYDVIVVAAPIKVSANLLAELLPLQPRALVFDISSLKSPLREPLRALADAGCKVTSVHPMFRPTNALVDRQACHFQ